MTATSNSGKLTEKCMRLTDGTERTFQIRKDGETVTTGKDNNSLHFDNEVVSGKVSLSRELS